MHLFTALVPSRDKVRRGAKKYAKTAPHRGLGETRTASGTLFAFAPLSLCFKINAVLDLLFSFCAPNGHDFYLSRNEFRKAFTVRGYWEIYSYRVLVFENYFKIIILSPTSITLRQNFYSPAVFNVLFDYE